jgi:hypothetical protein
LHQPWLDNDILSCQYTTPNHSYTSTDCRCTPHTIQQPFSPYHLTIPDCTEAHLASTVGVTSSHTHHAAADGQVRINLTPSCVQGHNVSISVTPHHESGSSWVHCGLEFSTPYPYPQTLHPYLHGVSRNLQYHTYPQYINYKNYRNYYYYCYYYYTAVFKKNRWEEGI